jgi:hypothetical protein
LEKFKIVEKIAPFSRRPGILCPIPCTDVTVSAYPTRLVIGDKVVNLMLTGPVKDFTLMLNLEKNCVEIWGIAKEGYFRIKLKATFEGVFLSLERGPESGLCINGVILRKKQSLCVPRDCLFMNTGELERLSLGNWKAQDWEKIASRKSLLEMASILFLLGQKVPSSRARLSESQFDLATSGGIAFPAKEDSVLLGIDNYDENPITFASSAYQTIRSFIYEDGSILPRLPKDWHSGRVLGLKTPWGTIDFDWRKSKVRTFFFHSTYEGDFPFKFCQNLDSRLKNVIKGKSYFLDRF